MKPMTLACVLICVILTGGASSALELHLGTAANVQLGGDAGLSLGLGTDAGASVDAAHARTVAQATTGGQQDTAASSSSDAGGDADQLAPVILLIESSKWKADAFAKLQTIAGHAYDVGTWVNANNEAELKAALDTNAEQIAELHTAIGASAAFTAWLKGQGLEPSQVVAVGVTTGGSLAVFTN